MKVLLGCLFNKDFNKNISIDGNTEKRTSRDLLGMQGRANFLSAFGSIYISNVQL